MSGRTEAKTDRDGRFVFSVIIVRVCVCVRVVRVQAAIVNYNVGAPFILRFLCDSQEKRYARFVSLFEMGLQ